MKPPLVFSITFDLLLKMFSGRYILWILFFVLSGLSSAAQKNSSTCESLVKRKKVSKAIKCYEDWLKTHPQNVKASCRLAELYYNQSDISKTKKYATRAANLNANDAYDPLYYLARKMSFKRDNTNAVFVLDLLANRVSEVSKKEKIAALKGNYLLQKYELKQPRYNVLLLNVGDSINTIDAEYLPSLSLDGNTMVFTRRIQGANEDFFITTKDSNGVWTQAQNLGYPPNTGYPDGAAKLSADGNYLFFTRCDMRSPNGYERGGCDLVFCYRTGQKNGKIIWSDPQYFKYTINTVFYEGQPCLSSDNKDLYFVSDREGGVGGKDIYVSHFVNNFWTKPENLGPQINTTGDETTPFIHPDNETLYFASTGHPNLGGADIFMSRKMSDKKWQRALNLGAPINSDQRDGGITINAKGDLGYLGTERAGSRGKLDIYSFELYEGIRPIPTLCLKGKVFDKKTKDIYTEEKIRFAKWPSNSTLTENKSNKGDASYTQALHLGQQYLLTVNHPGYRPFYKIVDLRKDTFSDNVIQNIRLRMPGLIDTLETYRLYLDSADQFTEESKKLFEKIKAKVPLWLEDSAQIKLYMQTYYYYGDSDTDKVSYTYFKRRYEKAREIRNQMLEAHFPESNSILRIDPFIWRDETESLNYIEMKFVEFY
jgi:hypothetical protein